MRRVAVIGPGRVGTAIARGLVHAGDEIVAVAGRGEASLARFRERVPGAQSCEPVEAGRAGELVVLAVPDDALEGLVRALARDDAVVEGSRWVHTAGGRGTEVLEPVRLAGARVAALHPAQTFPDPDTGYESLPGTAWAVTARPGDLGWARVLVTDLRGSPVAVPEGSRTLYHTGLTVGSNATASVVTLARELLLGAGIDEPAAFLGPLVGRSGANAAAQGAAALTGPVRRGDAGTVAAHLAELHAVLPEVVDAYVELSRLMLRHARQAGLDDEAAAVVEQVLDSWETQRGASGEAQG